MSLAGKRIFVGLSGGVDSAVSAALLKKQGAHITGVFIKGWYPPGMPCTWAEDRRDAMRVAASLGIPFHTLDASEEYRQGVIEYLLQEYKQGRTPNPDVMCNREVKFGVFYRFAKDRGADYIATGHYARTEGGSLLRGLDAAKDQSYFLWAIPAETLSYVIFPLGALHKGETRKIAARVRLPNAQKKDSQGICFLGSISVEDFLRSEFGTAPGEAVNEEGVRIGTHDGALLHTLGARIALAGAEPGPWYVTAKDVAENRLIVSKERIPKQATPTLSITNANWFGVVEADKGIEAQYRYHGPLVRGALREDLQGFIPETALPEPPAPGQSLVFYQGDRLIGGGIIAEDGIMS